VLILFFLKLSLLSQAIFYGFSASINHNYICDYSPYYYCMTAVFTPAGAEFLAIAVLINISKWVYFTLYIKAVGETETSDRVEKLQK